MAGPEMLQGYALRSLTREASICIKAAGCWHESRGKVLPVHQI